MTIRNAFQLAMAGWREGYRKNGSIPRTTPLVEVPQPQDIPEQWITSPFGPGAPIAPFTTTFRDKLQEIEPRSFQYVPNVNATISPRLAYGLMAFSELKYYAENVPEVSMCIRLLTETIKGLEPRIIGPDDLQVELPDLEWMVSRPDGFTPWNVWVSRFLFNVLAYDAGALFYLFDNDGKIQGVRVIDGSTIFAIIDERGEQPSPDAPAFTQIIYGQPRVWLSTAQLWYQPRQVRSDAPYGRTFIEDSLRAVQYLDNLWTYETAGYTEGTMPEAFLEAPTNWTVDQCLQWENAFNQRMSGASAERRRVRVVPAGFKLIASKDRPWNKDGYTTALERLTYNAGIPLSELGKAPGAGLGGKGYQAEGASEFMRIGFGPLISYLEEPFNYILQKNGYIDYTFELDFSTDEIDASERKEQATGAWTNGAITRDEFRQEIGYKLVGGEAGNSYLMPAGKIDVAFNGGEVVPQETSGSVPAETVEEAVLSVEENLTRFYRDFDILKHCGVCDDDDRFYGQPVIRVVDVDFPVQGANETEIVSITLKNGESRPAVWKPVAGEDAALARSIGGILAYREEAAFLVDRVMEFYLVPVSFVAAIGDEKEMGAVIHYVQGREQAQEASDYAPNWVEKAAILDYIIGQIDRAGHNWLTHPTEPKRPILIDNGLSFPVEKHIIRSAFVETYRGHRISTKGTNAMLTLQKNYGLWRDLEICVGKEAAQLAKERLEILLTNGIIPLEEEL